MNGINIIPQRADYVLQAGASAGHNPADATTYYVGVQPGFNPSSGETGFAAIMPRAGRVIRCYGTFTVLGTLGTTEQFTVAVRNQTDDTTENITTTLQGNAIFNNFNNTAMTLAFDAGEPLSVQFTTPTWTTNPTVTFWNITIEVEYTT